MSRAIRRCVRGAARRCVRFPQAAGTPSILPGTAYWLSTIYDGGSDSLTEQAGNGVGNAQLGSTSGADTNDPLRLVWAADPGDYVYLPGSAGNYVSLPDSAQVSVTGDIDIRVRAALDDWTGTAQTFCAKQVSGTSWRFRTSTTAGRLEATIGGNIGIQTVTSTVATGFSAGSIHWVRFTYDTSTTTAKFYTSEDGLSWSQLGGDLTTMTNTSITDTADIVELGSRAAGGGSLATGKFYSAQVYSDLTETTKVLDWNASSMTQSGGADDATPSAGTWTINESATGAKSALITNDDIQFSVDDYCEVADNALLDFSGSDDFSVAAYARVHGTPAANQVLLAKKSDLSTAAGYAIYINSSRQPVGMVADGTNTTTITGTALVDGNYTMISLIRNGANIELIQVDSVGTVEATPVTDTTSDLSNAEVMRWGRLSGAGTNYFEGMQKFVPIFKSTVLTGSQVATLYAEANTLIGGRVAD